VAKDDLKIHPIVETMPAGETLGTVVYKKQNRAPDLDQKRTITQDVEIGGIGEGGESGQSEASLLARSQPTPGGTKEKKQQCSFKRPLRTFRKTSGRSVDLKSTSLQKTGRTTVHNQDS